MSTNQKKIDHIRHSLAHLLAAAVLEKYPRTKLGIGPTIENGFYYDFLFPEGVSLNEENLQELGDKIKEYIKEGLPFSGEKISEEEAKKLFSNQPFKLDLIEEYISEGSELSIYKTGEIFTDLCRGGHVENTKEINPDAFKLINIAGAYWRGDESNQMLTRIYGLAFESKKGLDEYLVSLEEAEKRDHRKIGRDLELFMIDENIGQGLVLWLPKGAKMRKIIEDYLYEELAGADYQWLYTPHIANRKLWEISGHWNFYNESMYPPIEIGRSLEDVQKNVEGKTKEEYLLKPMNCPFHIQVYNSKIRSYNDLPIKYAELGTVYRYERSGTLHGLTRVRGFTQDDAHIFCHPEQMPEELSKLVSHGLKMLKDFGFSDFNIYLSTKPEKYAGKDKDWETATKELENVLKEQNIEYKIDEGGGVFYGPKIDIKIKDSLGREWQCTTIQFDFNLPERFNINFINKHGEKERPFMIHRALLGSMERFFGVLIEHYAGDFPAWLAPTQTLILPVSEEYKEYGKEIKETLKNKNIRAELDESDETLGKKIRNAEIQKIPYILVVGKKEKESNTVNVRKRHEKESKSLELEKFIENISKEIKNKN
jgi:threonyl-tRNA synthetase